MREALTQRTTWDSTPTAMPSISSMRQKPKAQKVVVKNELPPRRPIEILNEDEKWVLEALYKRLPRF